jgi:hypothetical protein
MTAKHELVTASETENTDLFWALKGAGQFFGLVTEVTMKIFPVKNPLLELTYIFPAAKVAAVAKALEGLCKEENRASPWNVIICAVPGTTNPNPILVVATKHLRPETEVDDVVKDLVEVGALQTIRKFTEWGDVTNSAEASNQHGGFRNMFSCGLQKFDGSKLVKGVEMWKEMVAKVPDTVNSFFLFDWGSISGMKENEGSGSAWSHRDCETWAMVYVHGPEEQSGRLAKEGGERFVYMCQEDQKESDRALFPNHTRVHSLMQRYRGEHRITRLKELKNIWDPQGVFTSHLLD